MSLAAGEGVPRLTDLPSSSVELVGTRVTRQLHDARWLPQLRAEDPDRIRLRPPVYRAFDVYLRRREQLRRRGN